MSYLFSLQETFHTTKSNLVSDIIQYTIYTNINTNIQHIHKSVHTFNNNCYYNSMRYLYTRTDISCIKRITVLSILIISKPVHFQAKSNNRRKFHSSLAY